MPPRSVLPRRVTLRRGLFGSLGKRLVGVIALVALLSAISTGLVITWLARSNILESQQNSFLAEFNRDIEAIPSPLPTAPNTSGAVTPVDVAQVVFDAIPTSNDGKGVFGVVLLSSGGASAGTIDPAGLPPELRERVESGNRATPVFSREAHEGEPSFIVGTVWTVSLPGPDGGTAVEAAVYAVYPLGEQDAQIRALTGTSILLSILIGLVAAVIGGVLARQLARPVTELRAAMERFDAAEEPLPLPPSAVDEVDGVITSFNDMSAELHRTMSELRDSEERARRFAADVSHELRTPTAALVALADVLGSPEATAFQRAEASELISSSARRVARLTEDLLEISRFDSRQAAVSTIVFDIGTRLADLVEAGFGEAGVELRTEPGLMVETDPRRFDLIVTNLLGNAAKHGAAPIFLEAAAETNATDEPGALLIRVCDHGDGVPAADLERIFDRFFKSDSSRTGTGTGLGLSLVEENVRLLGGTVAATSLPREMLFTVRLPGLLRDRAP